MSKKTASSKLITESKLLKKNEKVVNVHDDNIDEISDKNLSKKSKLFKMNERVLALSMRPKCLRDLVGQENIVNSLHEQFSSGRVPHFFLISGAVGAGKTTLARILALWLQNQTVDDIDTTLWNNYRKYDILEINAANKNGVDDIRTLVSLMRFKPVQPSTAKIVILDEAHQLTNAAQNALITETEDVADHIYYIFCTSAIGKIIPALKRRAYLITPKPLTEGTIFELLIKAHTFVKKESLSDITTYNELIESLKENEVTSPGLVLQAMERFLSGIPAKESVVMTDVSKLDIMSICRLASAGNWSGCTGYLKDITKGDVYALRASILGYFKTILLKTTGLKARNLSTAIKILTEVNLEDSITIPSFLAGLCLACEQLVPKVPKDLNATAIKNKIAS